LGSAGAVALLLAAPLAQAKTELKVATGLIRNHDQIEVYFDHFHDPINADSNAPVTLKYMGGPEVTPNTQLGAALKRGLFDIINSPSSYYAGLVPEGRYIAISNRGHKELRANGAYDLLQEAWSKGLNAKIISWPYWQGTEFHLYLVNKPQLSKETGITLQGHKMRSVSLYAAFLKGMGATPVNIKPAEVYTALQRGVVAGIPWPEGAITKYGWQTHIKWRVEPGFWRSSAMVVMNMDKYNSLTKAGKDYLVKAGIKLEDESGPAQRKVIDIDNAKVFKAGVQRMKLEGEYAKAYLDTIYGSTWEDAKTRKLSVPYAEFRAKLYKE
jgi:TRAP-type C4-dicarboxylate transport system substrate-binding protein